jgi:hypothetical protein
VIFELQMAAAFEQQVSTPRMLVIDEAQNILPGSRDQQGRLLNMLRWLGNELQIPLVAVGTAEALRAINCGSSGE